MDADFSRLDSGMLKRYTNNIDFDLYLDAASKLGITFVPMFGIEEPIGYFSLGEKRVYIQRNKLGVNNGISSSIARNKYRTSQILEKFDLPAPRAILFKSDDAIESLFAAAKGLRRPLVVKPLRGSLGKGVSINIDGLREMRAAVRFARKIFKTLVIEEFTAGTNYRVYVFDHEVIDIVERIPAYVTGDGKTPIKKLIAQKNTKRAESGLKPIRMDQELTRFVKKQSLDLTSVPDDGSQIVLRLNCNMASGGETMRVDIHRDVHPDNLEMFVVATREIGLALAGIDFITPDISKSYKDIQCAINEINRAPMLDAHYFADLAMNNVVGEKVLAKLHRQLAS